MVSPRLPVLTDWMPIDALAVSVTFETKSEGRAAAGDIEGCRSRFVERAVQIERHVQIVGAIADIQAIGLSGGTVDGDGRILAGVLGQVVVIVERAGNGLHGDKRVGTVSGAVELESAAAHGGAYAGGRGNGVDRGGDGGDGRAAGEAELLRAGVAGNFERRAARASVPPL